MIEFKLSRREINTKALIRRTVAESDTEHVISEPGIYCLDGKPLIIYGRFGARYDKMLWALKSIDYQSSTRTNGLKTHSRIFGFRPRIPLRSDFCSTTAMALTFPTQHSIVCEFGQMLGWIYRSFSPETFERHAELLKTVRSEWIIPGTPFTSGIINQNNPLKYHFDTGNFKDVLSCMAVFRHECDGGFLSVPEFNSRFMLDDHTFFLFDGQEILHGVTPIKKWNSTSYRYSVVYYALRSIGDCQSCEEELKRIRVLKRTREQKRK